MRKASLSLLAVAISSVLVGCGSGGDSSTSTSTSDSTSTETTVTEQGRFVDAAVEGLYYVSGAKSGYTAAGTGQYDIDTDTSVITFYLGGENGLEIGSLSARSISTPFEAAGTYERSINLARLLLTIDDTSDSSDTIVIPTSLQNVAAESDLAQALQTIALDDGEFENSISALLSLLSLTTDDIVSAEDAITHMTSSLSNLTRGSDTVLTDWAKGSGTILVHRSAIQRIHDSTYESGEYDFVVHADRTFGDDVFEQTAGLSASTYRLDSDQFVILAGSNDGNISGMNAEQYIQCAVSGGELSRQADGTPLCDGEEITAYDSLPSGFQYNLTDPTAVIESDDNMDWDYVADAGGAFECIASGDCSEQAMTQFEIIERDDSDEGEPTQMQTETLSGSYDPVTGVYTQVRSKQYTTGSNAGRVEESIEFVYPIDTAGEDRYVDFTGSWQAISSAPDCDKVATSTWTFDATGATVSGYELTGSGSDCELASIAETVTYAELADMDYWWFTTNTAGDASATLDQLNTTIRWTDDTTNKINRFSYIPAGTNWDMGTLVRDTLNESGEKTATTVMRKITQ